MYRRVAGRQGVKQGLQRSTWAKAQKFEGLGSENNLKIHSRQQLCLALLYQQIFQHPELKEDNDVSELHRVYSLYTMDSCLKSARSIIRRSSTNYNPSLPFWVLGEGFLPLKI